MKKLVIVIFALVAITACNNSGNKKTDGDVSSTAVLNEDLSVVNVYYFHGKQRCKTCIAVGNVAQETIKKDFAGNKNIRFTEVNTSEKTNEKLVEKYQVTWNALIIVKGDDAVDITEEAFATANDNPETLANRIKDEVNSRL